MESGFLTEELSVTIKAIKVNNKKMTLSVFKQLPNEQIIDFECLELKGKPWGKVNYFWGNQNKSKNIHLVWSNGSTLKRCLVEDFGKFSNFLSGRHDEYGCGKIYDMPIYEIPDGALQDAIDKVRSTEFENAIDKVRSTEFENSMKQAKHIYNKYLEIRNQLNSLEQLYIAT